LAGLRTTYSDWMLKRLPEQSGYSDGSAEFYDANLSLAHRVNERNSLILYGYFSRDRFSFDADNQYSYRNANASLAWRRFFGEKLLGVLSTGYDHYGYTTRNAVNPAEAYTLSFAISQPYFRSNFT
jgi:hypothetical protein